MAHVLFDQFRNFLHLLPFLLHKSSPKFLRFSAQISLQFPSIPTKPEAKQPLRRSKFGDGVDPAPESSFLDENGVVKDMDDYLNYLSLEYESVWDTKPSWCQPWTIVLTGVGIITTSWLILNSIDFSYLNSNDLNLFVVVHISLLLSKGIFGYDCRATKEGDEWSGRHLWDENREMNGAGGSSGKECAEVNLCKN